MEAEDNDDGDDNVTEQSNEGVTHAALDEEVTGDGEETTTDISDVTEGIGNNEEDESDLLPVLPPREFETSCYFLCLATQV